MVLYPNKLPESERVCSGICNVAMPTLMKVSIVPMGNCLTIFNPVMDTVYDFPFLLYICQQLGIVTGQSVKSFFIL